MTAPNDLIAELMQRVRHDLYAHQPEAWHTQQAMIKRALTYPAAWIGRRAVELSAARYRALLEEIIRGIVTNGQYRDATYLSRYFYTCVQRHMEHHGDDYYREGVSIRNNLTLAMTELEQAQRGADRTIPILAQVHATLAAKVQRPIHMKPDADPLQPDLFAAAKGRKRG